eukprot:Skav209716  [mRNA]  locus=scaffold528:98111:118791:- [translate_table: standard]
MKYGAALVVMAIGEQGRAVTAKDKVALLQRSYRLLRQKLDFPPEDIILDCHLQALRHDEHPSEVISAISELKRLCPRATLTVGLSNLSAAFGRGKLREALHSTFLQHAIPKGLNMALAPAGRLPLYEDLEPETRQLCEEVILNSQKNDSALKKFMAFLNFRSGNTVCLPLQAADDTADAGAWWSLPECKAAGKEAQKEYLEKRGPLPSPAQQKAYWSAMQPSVAAGGKAVPPDTGCERPKPHRVPGASSAVAQQAGTNTRNGDGLCQAFYGTEDATLELNKAAATLAKQARLAACVVSLLHAQPLAFGDLAAAVAEVTQVAGIGGEGASSIPLLSKTCSCWTQWTGTACAL